MMKTKALKSKLKHNNQNSETLKSKLKDNNQNINTKIKTETQQSKHKLH